MTLEILKANKNDLETVVKFSRILSSGDQTKTDDQIKTAVEMAANNNLLWVAKFNSDIIGYGLVELFDNAHKNFPSSIFIAQLFVDPKFRNQGIGKNLMEHMLKNEYPEQYKYFSVTHDPGCPVLTKFYEKFGFKYDGVTAAGNTKMVKPK